ncbi:histidine kinase [Prosthecobacter sp.]|uniref:sensor histidine kinase n=1 Tax=Prosthecobacter sp. TaxID=1965333 RepID=UPI001E121FE8|nr:histidine kinase [Prosthecobacter sp.]MCB1277098.1 hypothetical protein [Prosthecobacter sp.]
MSYVSLSPDVELGLVCDKQGVVNYSTQLQWRGMNVQSTPLGAAWKHFAHVLMTMEPVAAWDGEEKSKFVVMSPFFESYDPSSKAVVIIRYDATLATTQVREDAWHETRRQAGVLLALCLLLWFALDELVANRVRKVVEILRAAASREGPPKVLEGEDELSIISKEFAGAMEQLRVAENLVLDGAEQERRKIGRDLHDDLCQRLSATKMKAEVMLGVVEGHDEKSARLARQVAEELAESTVIARSMAWGLSPVGIERHGLKDAMEKMVRFAERSYQVKCSLDCANVNDYLSGSANELLFRIAQELVINACKHSSPSVMNVTIRMEGGEVLLSVIHDGKAFSEPPPGKERGMGLHLMGQRLRTLSATLERTVEKGEKDFSIATVRIPPNIQQTAPPFCSTPSDENQSSTENHSSSHRG